jgi:hypothetical protein
MRSSSEPGSGAGAALTGFTTGAGAWVTVVAGVSSALSGAGASFGSLGALATTGFGDGAGVTRTLAGAGAPRTIAAGRGEGATGRAEMSTTRGSAADEVTADAALLGAGSAPAAAVLSGRALGLTLSVAGVASSARATGSDGATAGAGEPCTRATAVAR